jgi:hypothetical protein
VAEAVTGNGADAKPPAPAHATTGKPAAAEPEPFFRPSPRQAAIHQRRFGLAYLLLAIGVGVAVGLGIVLIGRGSSSHTASGSAAFTPQQQGELGAREIAAHVGHEYRLPNGSDLVGVIGQRPSYQNVAMHDNLVRPSDAQNPKDVADLPIGNGIMFLLCGLGQNCSISGSPSPARTLLIEQEVLELALRTFKNDSDVQTVTALMPPTAAQPSRSQNIVAFFRRQDVAPLLGRPLSSTFTRRGPYEAGDVGQATVAAIQLYVDPALYLYRADYLPDGTPTLILDPFPHGP